MASFQSKKIKLANLIKNVSDHYGGDDIEWLRIYAQEIISANINQIDKAILCFEDLLK